MDLEEEAEAFVKIPPNRRAHQRHTVDEPAWLSVLKHEATIPCRIIDLSLAGCRLRASDSFLPGLHARVEVSFRVHGLLLRFNGEAQWTDDCLTVGIRFVDVTSRRVDELAEILTEVAAENAAKAAREAAKRAAEDALMHAVFEDEALSACEEAIPELELKPVPLHPVGSNENSLQPSDAIRIKAAKITAAKSERRKQTRHQVDTSAEVYLINVGSSVTGRILDLSPSGCHIRTDERFPLGIYIRVETMFRLHGLPFRLGGVTQAIRDRHNVGIRFVDMSDRKREYLDQLIAEIDEMRAGPTDQSHD
jgi:phosphoribosylanthranilate isomerase